MAHWSDKYWTPENLCANCDHPRDGHLDQAPLKGEKPSSDRGWCTLSPGTCIFSPCGCKDFIEPSISKIFKRWFIRFLEWDYSGIIIFLALSFTMLAIIFWS